MSHFFLPFSSDSLDRLSADGIKNKHSLDVFEGPRRVWRFFWAMLCQRDRGGES